MSDSIFLSRRRFLTQGGTFLAAGFAAPLFVRPGVLASPGVPGPSDRVAVGFIGAGGRGRMLMNQMPKDSLILAVADCNLPRAAEAAKDAGRRRGEKWDVYRDYRRILERDDIEAVVVPTTDHARVRICIHACQAGKDIYAEKPLSVTVHEGRVLVRAVRKYRRVFQTGSQQRSMEMNEFACRFVRTGGLGKVHTVLCSQYTGPRQYTGLPEQPVPEGLDWDAWCAQTELRPYNRGLHLGWMAWRSYSGGEMTNWGAHGMDQVQWALGADGAGPLELEPLSDGPSGKVRLLYPGGVTVRLEITEDPPLGGALFVGEKGRILIRRNRFKVWPPELVTDAPDPRLAEKWKGNTWPANGHLRNWIMCVKSRKRPVADVEIGHRSISVCHLCNITREVGRKLRWDPRRERFIDDPEADAYLERPKRKGYELPERI